MDRPDPLANLRRLTEAHAAALAPREALPVPALKTIQAEKPILVATCPGCRTVAGISGHEPGRHQCRGCGLFLAYTPND